jgi:hypothetical protein
MRQGTERMDASPENDKAFAPDKNENKGILHFPDRTRGTWLASSFSRSEKRVSPDGPTVQRTAVKPRRAKTHSIS